MSDYDAVKELLLKGYELVPEAYRQKFRDCRKENMLKEHVDRGDKVVHTVNVGW